MTDCEKVKDCGREAYARGLCLTHLKPVLNAEAGQTPKRPARKRAAGKKAASRSRSATSTTEATGQTSEPPSEVTS